MKTFSSNSLKNLLALAILAVGFAMSAGRVEAKLVSPTTGHVIAASEMLNSIPRSELNDSSYAEVDSKWLKKFYSTFRQELFRQGIVKWENRFNCRRFAAYYTEMAQSHYSVENDSDTQKASSLAIGTFWYKPDNSPTGHAIVVAMTERGRIFIEPQTGNELSLNAREIASVYHSMF